MVGDEVVGSKVTVGSEVTVGAALGSRKEYTSQFEFGEPPSAPSGVQQRQPQSDAEW